MFKLKAAQCLSHLYTVEKRQPARRVKLYRVSSCADVVARALKKDQDARYANAGEMHADLQVIDRTLLCLD